MGTEIWKYDRGRYKVYVEDRELRNKLQSWKDCVMHGGYSHVRDMREYAWDFIFPGKIYDKVAALVGLPPKKKVPELVARGKRLGKLAVANDHLHLQIQPSGYVC